MLDFNIAQSPRPTNNFGLHLPVSRAVIEAQAAEIRLKRQTERAHEERRNAEIRRLRALGWSYARIAPAVALNAHTVRARVRAMGLTEQAIRHTCHTDGMTGPEREAYRLYLSKGWTAAEARAEVLSQRRRAA